MAERDLHDRLSATYWQAMKIQSDSGSARIYVGTDVHEEWKHHANLALPNHITAEVPSVVWGVPVVVDPTLSPYAIEVHAIHRIY